MGWSIAQAKQRLSEVVRLAAREPQPLYNRGRLVGALIDAESYQAFYDLLPHALRDPDLRERVAALYDGYRETVLRCLDASGPDAPPEMRPFAMLMIAIVDGLAIQHGLDPDGADVRAATELWERLARPFLAAPGEASS